MILILYFLRNLVGWTVVVSACLAWILWLSQTLRFVGLVVQKGLLISTFLLITLLSLPSFIVTILPVSLFISTLSVYNKFNNDHELIALKAAGTSNIQLGIPVLVCSIVVMVVCYILTIYGIPSSVEQFHQVKSRIRQDNNNLASTLFRVGIFTEVADGIVLYTHSRLQNGEFLGLFVHDTRFPQHIVTIFAERGALFFSGGRLHISMFNGNRQEVRQSNLETLDFKSCTLNINTNRISVTEKKRRFRDARERELVELLRATENTEGLSTSDIRRFKIEAHQRLILPFLNLSFSLVAISTLLIPNFSRRNQAIRSILATGAVSSIEIAVLSIINSASWQVNAVAFLYCVVFIPLLTMLYFLYFFPFFCKR